MSHQHGLAQRVAVLRERLEEIDRLGRPTTVRPSPRHDGLHLLRRDLQYLEGESAHLDARLAELCPELLENLGLGRTPRQLAGRTRRLLLRGRELLVQLKRLGEHLGGKTERVGDVLGDRYRQTLALAELTLRAVQTFPESTAEQLRLCDGLDTALASVEQRVVALRQQIRRQHARHERLKLLAHVFTALLQGRPILLQPLRELVDVLRTEARQGEPLDWPDAAPERADLWVASHCLAVAQVMARVAPVENDALVDAVLAALVFDCGMAGLDMELLRQVEPLDEEQRRQMEAHVGLSADAALRLMPKEDWLVQAIRQHHERANGSGYPLGLSGEAITPLARLLSACDTYVALASPRCHRAALTPRAALAETLREAERGRLDLAAAERLLALSFYPIGTKVELSDGQTGVVVATHPVAGDLSVAGRPVVQMLADCDGEPLPDSMCVDLARDSTRHVARVMTENEFEP